MYRELFYEGQQADEYRARKAKEKEEQEKRDQALKDRADRKMDNWETSHYQNALELSNRKPMDFEKFSDNIHKEGERKGRARDMAYGHVFNSKNNDETIRRFNNVHQSMDSAERWDRRHSKSKNLKTESGIFEAISLI